MSLPLFLFSHDPGYASSALRAGVHAVVVDWEWRGKDQRQSGAGTEINRGTIEDLVAMRAATAGRVVCRINNTPDRRAEEARLARELGADEVWLPMVRSLAEVEECLRAVGPRVALGVLAETRDALALARGLSALPLARVYFGLNDFRIDNGHDGLFEPLVDGTVDRFREHYHGCFGVAGVTRPDSGFPIAQALLLGAMARLRCGFAVARRSFRADVPVPALAGALGDVDAAWNACLRRDADAIAADHRALASAVRATARDRQAPAMAAAGG